MDTSSKRPPKGRGGRQQQRPSSTSRGGRGGGRAGAGGGFAAGSQPKKKVQAVPVGVMRRPSEIINTVVDNAAPVQTRLAALKELEKLLKTPTGQKEIGHLLMDVPPLPLTSVASQLCGLLWDRDPAVVAVGPPLLHALAALPGGSSGATSGGGYERGSGGGAIAAILVDELVPVVKHWQDVRTGARLTGSEVQRAVLVALAGCLPHIAGIAAFRRFANVIGALQHALNDHEITKPEAIGEALDLLAQSLKQQHVAADAGGLTLSRAIGAWAVKKDLPHGAHTSLSKAMQAVSSGWKDSAADLILGELVEAAAAAAAEITASDSSVNDDDDDDDDDEEEEKVVPALNPLLALATCAVPLVQRDAKGELACSTVRRARQLVDAFSVAVSQAVANKLRPAQMHEVLKTVTLLVVAVLTPVRQQKEQIQNKSAPVENDALVRVELSLGKLPWLSDAVETERSFAAVDAENEVTVHVTVKCLDASDDIHAQGGQHTQTFFDKGVELEDVCALFAAALNVSRVVLQAITATRSDAHASQHPMLGVVCGAMLSWVTALPTLPRSLPDVDAKLLTLCSPLDGELAKLRAAVAPAVVRPLARLYVHLLVGNLPELLGLILEEIHQLVSQSSGTGGGGLTPTNKGYLLFDLNVVHAALKSGLHEARIRDVWKGSCESLLLIVASAPEQAGLKALQLAQDAAHQARNADEVIHLAARVATAKEASDGVIVAALRWIVQVALRDVSGGKAGLQTIEIALSAVTRVLSLNTTSTMVHAAGFASAAHLVSTSGTTSVLYSTSGRSLALRLGRMALTTCSSRLPSVTAKTLEHAQTVLHTCAPPLALSIVCGDCTTLENEREGSLIKEDERVLSWAYAAVTQRQQHVYQGQNAATILDAIAGSGPSTLLSGAGTAAVGLPDDALRLELSASTSSSAPAAAIEDEAAQTPLVDAASDGMPRLWFYALNELATQCVTRKLSTHWGTAEDTFAALEASLSRLEKRLHTPSGGGQAAVSTTTVLRQGRVLLHFMYALEQAVSNAVDGSLARWPIGASGAAWYAGNSKACKGWFGRLRPALIRAAAGLSLPHHVVYHGMQRLLDLRSQAVTLVAARSAGGMTGTGMLRARPETPTHAQQGGFMQPFAATLGPRKVLLKRQGAGVAEQSPASALLTDASSNDAADTRDGAFVVMGATKGEDALRAGFVSTQQTKQKVAMTVDALRAELVETVGSVAAGLLTCHDVDGMIEMQAICHTFSDALNVTLEQWAWLEAAILLARGRAEECLRMLGEVLEKSSQLAPVGTMELLHLEAYAALNDVDNIQAWKGRMPQHGLELISPGTGLLCSTLGCWSDVNADVAERSSASVTSSEILATMAAKIAVEAPSEFGLQAVAAELGALACLNISDQLSSPQVQDAGLMLRECFAPLREDSPSLSCWGPSRGSLLQAELPCLEYAAVITPALLQGASKLPAHHVGRACVQLVCAGKALQHGNLRLARRLLDETENAFMHAPNVVSAAIIARLRMLQLFSSESSEKGAAEFARAAAEEALQSLIAQGEEDACAADAQLRAGLILALKTPDEYVNFAKDDLLHDARIFWEYARHMHAIARDQRRSSGAAEPLSTAHAEAYLASMEACCRALALGASHLAEGNSNHGHDALPSLLLLVRLVTRHGQRMDTGVGELHGRVHAALATVPASVWRPVIPHLISALATSTDDTWLGDALHGLLTSIANSDVAMCAAVLFPTLAELNGNTGGGSGGEHRDAASYPSLERLVEGCMLLFPRLAQSAAAFTAGIAELSILEDERWHAILQEAHAALKTRLAAMYAQRKGMVDNNALAAKLLPEQYALAIAPVLSALQSHLAGVQTWKPTSPHAIAFLERVKLVPRLQWLIEQLSKPLLIDTTNMQGSGGLESALQRPLRALKMVSDEVAQAVAQHGTLSLRDVSPQLATEALQGSQLPLPGGLCGTLDGIDGDVYVMRTKNRPKKIRIRIACCGCSATSSGGGLKLEEHTFLVKGSEDMRVDAHVAGFLSAVSAAFRADPAIAGAGRTAIIVPLVVIPVAQRAGLVRWVDDSKSLYEAYTGMEVRRAERDTILASIAAKSYVAEHEATTSKASGTKEQRKKRHRRGKASKAESSNKDREKTSGGKQQANRDGASRRGGRSERNSPLDAANNDAEQKPSKLPQRPVDRFRAKLRAAGVDTAQPRASWPLEVMKKVFEQLSSEVEPGFIALELKVAAAGPAHWWQRQRAFAASSAALSILGYLLGVGDRHLDNILLDVRTGAVIHVDFGVLFDRGQRLTVPELVPFRLTQCITRGLGPAGAAGAFHLWCERTLSTVRANDESLAATLEAGLNDPLVHWNRESDAKQARKVIEKCIELAAFLDHEDAQQREGNVASGGMGPDRGTFSKASVEAAAVLKEAHGLLTPFAKLFDAADAAVTAVVTHRQVVARCKTIVQEPATKEGDLLQTVKTGRDRLQQLRIEADAAAAELVACETECRAWQDRHANVLQSLAHGDNAIFAIHACPQHWDPVAALLSSSTQLTLGMVQPWVGSRDASTLLDVAKGAIGVSGSSSASGNLLLPPRVAAQAADVDAEARALLVKRSEAMRRVLGASMKYAAMVAPMVPTREEAASQEDGGAYWQLSRHATWCATLSKARAALSQLFERSWSASAEGGGAVDAPAVAEQQDESIGRESLVATWRRLCAEAHCIDHLIDCLRETNKTLERERIDVALSAGEAKASMALTVMACSAKHGIAALAKLCERQADAVDALRATSPGSNVLDGVQQVVLGLVTTILSVRTSASSSSSLEMIEAIKVSTDWLADAVRAADAISTLAGEVQLSSSGCAALLCSAEDRAALRAHFEEIREACLSLRGDAPAFPCELQTLANGVMAKLVEIAQRWPSLGTALQCLHSFAATLEESPMVLGYPSTDGMGGRVHESSAAMRSKLDEESVGGLASDMEAMLASISSDDTAVTGTFLLAASAVDLWSSFQALCDEEGFLASHAPTSLSSQPTATRYPASSSSSCRHESSTTPSDLLKLWEGVSDALARAASSMVQRRFLPALTTALERSAAGFASFELSADRAASAAQGGFLDEQQATSASTTRPFKGTVALPTFFEFESEELGEQELEQELEALEDRHITGNSETTPSKPEEEEKLGEESVDSLATASTRVDMTEDDELSQLVDGLSSCVELSGAVAAIDSVRHVSALVLQAAREQAHDIRLQLVRHEWTHEPEMLSVLCGENDGDGDGDDRSNDVLSTFDLSKISGRDFAVEGDFSIEWRHSVLSKLRDAAGDLAVSQEAIDTWQCDAKRTLEEVCGALISNLPLYAAGTVTVAADRTASWLEAAHKDSALGLQVAYAILDFESSRKGGLTCVRTDNDVIPSSRSGGGGGGDCPVTPGASFFWSRYEEAVAQAEAIEKAAHQTEVEVQRAESALKDLHSSKEEAMATLKSHEQSGDAAQAALNACALPLVKAVNKIGPDLESLHSKLSNADSASLALSIACQRLARVASQGTSATATGTVTAASSLQNELETALNVLRAMQQQVPRLRNALRRARQCLQIGGRGEAAARSQAEDVVKAVNPSMQALRPAIGGLDGAASTMQERVPKLMGDVALGVEEELQGLCASHPELTCTSLPRPLEGSKQRLAMSILPQVCRSSVHLYPPFVGGQAFAERKRAFAATALSQFVAKMRGSVDEDGHVAKGGEGEALDVRKQIKMLIENATSVEKLCLMFEGWMGWV